jgi:signal peptidase I
MQEDAISTKTDSTAKPATDSKACTPTAHTLTNEFYFLLGDRTSLSVDSRHWGLIPRAWVIGTPIAVYWSVEPGSADGGLSSRLQGIRWSRLGHLVR